MVCTERGVLPGSQYFFFSPSESFLERNYGVTNCGYFQCRFGYHIEREGNRFPILIYVIDGEISCYYENEHYVAHKGELVLIDCSKPHKYYVDMTCNFYYFHFTGNAAYEVTDQLIQGNHSPVFHLNNSTHLRQTLDQVMSKLLYDQRVTDVELSCMAYQCLCTLQAAEDIYIVNSGRSNDIVEQTATYIQEHLSNSFTLTELASHVNMSNYYFAHLFKKETGISPVEFAARTKINYAKMILKSTDNSIRQITDLLGYSSSGSFINAFKRRVGISPAKFRKLNEL